MRAQFPLFQTPIDLAHAYWKQLVRPGDLVIDATCGNGYDSLLLAQLAGTLYALDIDPVAIATTEKRLSLAGVALNFVYLLQQSHVRFPETILPASVRLVVYNLGYLPGGDKKQTTEAEQTLQSLQAALPLIMPGGCISITAYPGHQEGQREEEALLAWTAALDPQAWSVCHHRWTNRRAAPSLFVIQRAV